LRQKNKANLALQKKSLFFEMEFCFQARLLTKQGKLEEASQILEKKIPFIPEDSDFFIFIRFPQSRIGEKS
jgi:hypothetical protein